MKNLIGLIVLLAALASCNKPPPPVVEAAPDPGDKNIELVKKYADAGAKGDTLTLEAILADNAVLYGPGINDSSSRAQDLKFWKDGWKNEWTSLEFDRATVKAFTIPSGEKFPGDWVSDWGKWTVKEKNGKTVSFWWNGVFKVVDGKITEARTFFNIGDFYDQEGYVITPPKAEKKK